jgi:hypothetical protein
MWKRAALIFDQISIPSATAVELDLPDDVWFWVQRCFDQAICDWGKFCMTGDLDKVLPLTDDCLDANLKRLMSSAYERSGILVTPIYRSDAAFALDYKEGPRPAYQAGLQSIPVILEDGLTWRQVLEIRKDSESIRKIRDFRIWLIDGLKATSLGHARDIIEQKVDAYGAAIKKHGIRTVSGALRHVLDAKQLSAIVAGAGLATVIGGPIWGAIASGSLLTAQATTWIAERLLDHDDIKRGKHSEVALIYEVRRKQYKSHTANE